MFFVRFFFSLQRSWIAATLSANHLVFSAPLEALTLTIAQWKNNKRGFVSAGILPQGAGKNMKYK